MRSINWMRWWFILALLFAGLYCAPPPAHAEVDPPMMYGYCSPNLDQVGLQCTEKCSSGYTKVAGVCWQNCPSGFKDVGAFCSNLDVKTKVSYGRTAGKPMVCKPGEEMNGALCYPQCKSGYYGVGPVCWESCPPGTDTDMGASCVRWPKIVGWKTVLFIPLPIMDPGWTHWKNTYGRGAGVAVSACASGSVKDGALCYPQCKSGFDGVGPVCWERCASGYTNDGAFCRRDNGFAKKSYVAATKAAIKRCPDYPKDTKYPIVLVHGLFGFDKLLNVSSYFNQIPECLRDGGAKVFTPAVSAGNSTEVRGEQLLAEVRRILKDTGAEKVHLIGHSHGGPTSRYVAGKEPQLVASVTTVGGVNYGSLLADLMLKMLPDGTGVQTATGAVVDVASHLITMLSGHSISNLPQDVVAATRSLSTEGSAKFNLAFPAGLAGPGKSLSSPLGSVTKDGKEYPMLFYSWTGKAPFLTSLGWGVAAMRDMNLLLFLPQGVNSDGLVGVDSAHFGYFLGAYHHDHLDEVNMAVSTNFSMLEGLANPVTLFAEHVARLRDAEKSMLQPAYDKMKK